MRDEHLDSGHQEAKSQAQLFPSDPDIDEIQPLFFDLIRLDKVEAVKSILDHLEKLSSSVRAELEKLVVSYGSVSMAEVVYNRDNVFRVRDIIPLVFSIRGMNFETFRWLLSRNGVTESKGTGEDGLVLRELLISGSPEMFQECEEYLIDRSNKSKLERKEPYVDDSMSLGVIKATAGDLVRENLLLSLWAALEIRSATSKLKDQYNLDTALLNVAKTTCSIVLAKALLQYGANANFKKHDSYLSPLHYAARQSSLQAAELTKLLLYHGADPELQAGRSKLKISEEKGAKEIAKWLGMSWDELIQKIKLDREKGICPPEYT